MSHVNIISRRSGLMVQLISPTVRIRRGEFFAEWPTRIRIIFRARTKLIGAEVFGFGIGILWEPAESGKESKP